MDDVEAANECGIVGWTLEVVPEPSRPMVFVVCIGIDHAGNAPALVQELEPVDDRVVGSPRARPDYRPAEDLVGRMDLDDVDVTEHAREARIRGAVAVAVAKHPPDIG